MSPQAVYVSKTEHYLKVKKPLLERQRRARMNQYLDTLKTLIAEFQGDDAILRMDKAEMLEAAISFVRAHTKGKGLINQEAQPITPDMNSFRNGYMNAVNEVSRVMAATPGMSVDVGKAVMTHLGCEFNRLLHCKTTHGPLSASSHTLSLGVKLSERPSSPASSGYHSDSEVESPLASPTAESNSIWRPW